MRKSIKLSVIAVVAIVFVSSMSSCKNYESKADLRAQIEELENRLSPCEIEMRAENLVSIIPGLVTEIDEEYKKYYADHNDSDPVKKKFNEVDNYWKSTKSEIDVLMINITSGKDCNPAFKSCVASIKKYALLVEELEKMGGYKFDKLLYLNDLIKDWK